MLHNIFKRKSKKNKTKKPTQKLIYMDIHEKNSLIPSYLHELKAKTEIKDLKVGDYLIENIAIERKTFSDLVSSILNKRLIQQLNQLQQYKNPLLIIEGLSNLEELKEISKINPNAIRGFIISTLLNQQIPIIFTEDQQDTASYLLTLAKQLAKKPQEISFHARIPKTKKQQKKYIIESFPNIGPKTAAKLLKKFKTIKNIINADEEELKPILKSRTKQFLELLNKS